MIQHERAVKFLFPHRRRIHGDERFGAVEEAEDREGVSRDRRKGFRCCGLLGRDGRSCLCGNQNFTARARRVILHAIDSTRRLLDGVVVLVPHRSTEPARPRHRREMT